MGRAKQTSLSEAPKRRRPDISPEARENQMISYAIDLAEKQLIEGTASSQVITHFLKLGSTKERIEKEILEKQKDLIEAKTKAYQASDEIKELYAEALKAMRTYSGQGDADDEYQNLFRVDDS